MLRAVLDANVLISAAIRPSGPPGRIVDALLTRAAFSLVLSPWILAEVQEALELPKIRKYLQEPAEALLWVADLAAIADLVEDTGRVAGVSRDPADDSILGAAVEGRAHLIVTGDDDLLTLREHRGVAIVTPRAFWNRIRI